MKALILILALASVSAQAQQPPVLSTADRVAIQALEKTKADAQKQYQDAQQGEAQIVQEWQAAHPGFILTPQFEVKPKPAEKPAEKK